MCIKYRHYMRVHVWFECNFVLLLHGTATLSTAYDKQSIFSVLKLVNGKKYSNFEMILGVNNKVVAKTRMTKRCIAVYTVSHILYSILFLKWRLVLLVCVIMLVEWSIFMDKVLSKIRFDVLLGGGYGFMKNVASVPKLIYEWHLQIFNYNIISWMIFVLYL